MTWKSAAAGGEQDGSVLLEKTQQHVDGLDRFFRTMLVPNFYNERKPEDCTTAQKTFEIPELLEMILAPLSFVDILNSQQTSKTNYATIQESPRLQRHLGVRAEGPDSEIRTPFASAATVPNSSFACRQRACYVRAFSYQNVQTSTIMEAGFSVHAHQLPRIGSRWRSMLICQPPLHSMTVVTNCCAKSNYVGEIEGEVGTITSDTGLTIGDLYDHTLALGKEHRMCGNAYGVEEHDEDGFVNVRVTFRASISPGGDALPSPSPLPRVRSRWGPRLGPEEERRDARMRAYIKYKGAGK
jgi:hypothetical protein